ncbi:MAG: hypothetical protein V1859_01250 [archaeon]
MKKRCQVSIEFLAIFSFAFLMLIPLVVIYFHQSSQAKDALDASHIRNIAVKIAEKAESVYYMGEPSKITLKVNFPYKIHNISIENREITFNFLTYKNQIQDISEMSSVNITGNISEREGIHYISIEAREGYVLVSE